LREVFRYPQNLHGKREIDAPSLDTLRPHSVLGRSHTLAVKATVLIRPKEGILDPQGEAVENALPALGFSGVSHVHVGRLVELEIEDDSQLESMCEKLLANPLIEDYEIVQSPISTA
jgi:phosphoribosylformylglycinamidine synthase